MNIDQRTIKEVFDFGFEQMNCEPCISGIKAIYDAKDFELGGKMYEFRNYTVSRFRREFAVTISFC